MGGDLPRRAGGGRLAMAAVGRPLARTGGDPGAPGSMGSRDPPGVPRPDSRGSAGQRPGALRPGRSVDRRRGFGGGCGARGRPRRPPLAHPPCPRRAPEFQRRASLSREPEPFPAERSAKRSSRTFTDRRASGGTALGALPRCGDSLAEFPHPRCGPRRRSGGAGRVPCRRSLEVGVPLTARDLGPAPPGWVFRRALPRHTELLANRRGTGRDPRAAF